MFHFYQDGDKHYQPLKFLKKKKKTLRLPNLLAVVIYINVSDFNCIYSEKVDEKVNGEPM